MSLPKHPSCGQANRWFARTRGSSTLDHAALCCHSAAFTPTLFCSPQGPLQKYTCAHTTRRKTIMGTKFLPLFRCTALKYLLLLLAVVLCSSIASAQVAPTSQFQLDGTAAKNTGYPACTYTGGCDYWDLLNGSGGASPTGAAGSSIARTFINGESSTTAFIGGC